MKFRAVLYVAAFAAFMRRPLRADREIKNNQKKLWMRTPPVFRKHPAHLGARPTEFFGENRL
jgi:hypothetical protein